VKRKSEEKKPEQKDLSTFIEGSELIQMSNLNSNTVNRMQKRDKSWCLTGNSSDQGVVERKQLIGGSQGMRVYSVDGTSTTITAHGGGQGAKTGLYYVGAVVSDKATKRLDGKNLSRNFREGQRVYDSKGIASALTASGKGSLGGATGLYAVGSTQEHAAVMKDKSPALTDAMGKGGGHVPMIVPERMINEAVPKIKKTRSLWKGQSGNVYDTDGISPSLCSSDATRGYNASGYIEVKQKAGEGSGTRIAEPKIKRVDGKPNVYKTDAQAGKIYEVDGISPSVTGQRINSQGFIAIEDKRKMKKIGGYSQCGSAYSTDGIFPTVSACTHGYANPHIVDPTVRAVLTPGRKKKKQNGRRVKSDGEDAFTVTANEQNGVMLEEMRIRRLTPKECERLQGFPDDFTSGVSDTQRYRQMGNAVTVPVVEFISSYFPK
jgi:hypothetical protein